jgi:hypothetical protein
MTRVSFSNGVRMFQVSESRAERAHLDSYELFLVSGNPHQFPASLVLAVKRAQKFPPADYQRWVRRQHRVAARVRRHIAGAKQADLRAYWQEENEREAARGWDL